MLGELEIVLAPGAVRMLLMSGLGVDDGLEHVRASLTTAAPDRRGSRIAMRPDDWRALERYADRRSVHGPGAHFEDDRQARAYALLAMRIERAIERLAAHPAYRGLAAMGHHREVLPAWRTELASYPVLDKVPPALRDQSEAGALWPERITRSGRVLTRWRFRAAVAS